MMKKKSWILLLVMAVMMSTFLAACGGGGETTSGNEGEANDNAGSSSELTELSGELNVFNWSEYLPQSVIDKFEEEYGVKVNYNTYSSNEEMLAKISAGAVGFDIAVASDYMVEVMIKQDLLLPINKENIPNMKNLGQDYLDLSFDPGNKYSIPYMWGKVLLAVNTDKVSTEVTSYADLWKPEFENSLVVLDDQRTLIGIANKMQGESMNATDEAVLEKSKQLLLDLLPNIKAYDSDSPKTMLINGEAKAGIVWGAEASLASQENPAVKAVLPEEGMQLWQDNFVIPKGAPHQKTAEVFMDFILRPEISAEISKEFPYGNPNEAAHEFIDEAILNDPAVYPPSDEIQKGEFLIDVGEATRLYDRIWSEIKQ